ncbi:MAG TPA: ABC transporter permease [Blastocatellia bacterium]|nr:ABC transporter permease [Blastocatellia bacterium]
MMETLLQDFRYGVRMLFAKPGFTAIAIFTLALGIGANTAIFSVVNGVLLRPLPYKEPDRIVQFWETNPIKNWTQANVAPANFFDWEKQSQSFEEMAAYFGSSSKEAGLSNFFLTGSGEPERVQGLYVTGGIFSVLGVNAAFGRTFLPEETWEGNHRVVVLSHNFWRRRFGADPNILGQTITLSGQDYTVIGVMPADFYFPSTEVELWTPMGWNSNEIAGLRRPHFLRAIARLKPGVSLEQARAEMTAIASVLEEQYPDTNTQMGVGLGLLHEWIVSDTRLTLLVLLVAVGFVLAVACANVANLLLVRAAARTREIAIRTALGAGRWRIIRQLLTESLLLSLMGGAAGLLLALWGKDLLLAFSPENIPRLNEVRLDATVLVFALLITLVTALFFGLAPALAGAKVDLNATLKDGGQKGTTSPAGRRLRNILVVAEIALAVVLVIGAGLLIRSFLLLRQIDPGFPHENLLTLRISLPTAKYQPQQVATFFQQAQERIGSLPGVKAVGATSELALQGYRWTSDFTIEGRPPEEYGKEVRHKEITPEYFQAVSLPLLSGRAFSHADNAQSPLVVIINETLARRHFPNEDPVGKRLKLRRPEQEGPWSTIVGVVKDEKQDGLGIAVQPEMYHPLAQNPTWGMSLIVRTTGDPTGLIGAIRQEIWAIDNTLPPYDIKTMDDILYESLASERFTMLLLGIFAFVALALAGVGIYGVMLYSVTQRTREIGIRIALGARTGDVLRIVLGQAVLLALTGLAVGLAAAFALTRLLSSLLYQVSATDPATFFFISLLLGGVALLASYLPARRATKVDPMVALRYE